MAVLAELARDQLIQIVFVFDDVQVIVALNSKGDLSRENVSTAIQQLLNGDAKATEGTKFRVGDKAIETRMIQRIGAGRDDFLYATYLWCDWGDTTCVEYAGPSDTVVRLSDGFQWALPASREGMTAGHWGWRPR